MNSSRVVSRSSQAGSILALETTLRLLVSGISHLYAEAGEEGPRPEAVKEQRLKFVRGIREAVEETIREGMTVAPGGEINEDELMDGAQASVAMVFHALEREIEDGCDK